MSEAVAALEQEYAALSARLKVKEADLKAAQAEYVALVSLLVDAEATERPALLKRKHDLATLRGDLADDITLLAERRGKCLVAQYTNVVEERKAAAEKLHARGVAARVAVNAAMNSERAFLNRGGREGASDVQDRRRAELADAKARAVVEGAIVQRDGDKARLLLERAKADLLSVRENAGLAPVELQATHA